ncbi:unnamed protein product [Nyctereutes procyonoides]|uniref:(raccoon dog) hypothetical protein n=1 Tax=Nyctereutes procyonoides TaxID=34880 RepID=A0A811ZTS1_NYCPR|nr:unnamed protein product [Nyctereutes procyonoides]
MAWPCFATQTGGGKTAGWRGRAEEGAQLVSLACQPHTFIPLCVSTCVPFTVPPLPAMPNFKERTIVLKSLFHVCLATFTCYRPNQEPRNHGLLERCETVMVLQAAMEAEGEEGKSTLSSPSFLSSSCPVAYQSLPGADCSRYRNLGSAPQRVSSHLHQKAQQESEAWISGQQTQ